MIDAATNSKNETAAYHHGDLRRTLIAAALELAAEGKDWNFSLREVARRAGVSHNAPYNHFAHKRELMAAAAIAGHEALRAEVVAALAKSRDPRAAISRMGSAYVEFGIQNAALYQLMFNAPLSAPDWKPEGVVTAYAETRRVVEDVIRAGVAKGLFPPAVSRKGNLQTASLFAWSAVHGLTMLAINGLANVEEGSFDRVTEKVMDMVLDGMGHKE